MLKSFKDLTRSSRFLIFSWSIDLFNSKTLLWENGSDDSVTGKCGGGRSGSGGAGFVGIVCKGGWASGLWGELDVNDDAGGSGAGAIGGLQISLRVLQSKKQKVWNY